MDILAPPTIVEPLSVCSHHVRLKDQMTGAQVDLFIDGLATPIGGGVADWADQWFPLNPGVTLQPGQVVRAKQTLGPDTSPVPGIGETVTDRSTTDPRIVAPLIGCSDIVVIDGLTAGADVSVLAGNGAFLGGVTAPGIQAVVTLNRNLGNGEVVHATTQPCGGATSAPAWSLPAEALELTPERHMLPPRIDGELRECMRVVHFTATVPGATVYLERDSGTIFWKASGTELKGRISPSLVGGEHVRYWQEPPSRQCEAEASERLDRTVESGPPGPPSITSEICPGSKTITISDLVPSAVVRVMSGPAVIRQFEASETSREVDLSNAVLSPGQMLTVVQGLCNVFGPPSPVPAVVTEPALNVAPHFPEELVACAHAVRVAGVAAGSYVEIYSDRLKGRIGRATAYGDEVDVTVTPKLEPPFERISVVVYGCASGMNDAEVGGPVDMPPFQIAVPIEGDRSVLVTDLVPGSIVEIMVDGHKRGETATGGRAVRVPVAPALREGQQVTAAVLLCGDRRMGRPVTVAGPLHVHWYHPTARGLEVEGGHYRAGRVRAVLPLDPSVGDQILAGTEAGGLWSIGPVAPAFPLSGNWPMPQIRSLAYGTRGARHLYCGTEDGLLETDPSGALFLLSWTRVNGLPGPGGVFVIGPQPGGDIYDILVLGAKNTIVVATDAGVWWSTIPATTGTGYTWVSHPVVNQEPYVALCEGPNSSVVAYRQGAPGGRIAVGTWNGAALTWAETTPGVAAPHADSRMATVVTRMGYGALASCAADRTRVYAALADSTDKAWLAVLRSDDGGLTWTIPYTDPMLNYFKPSGTIDMGFQATRNLRIGAHPLQRDTVILAGRRSGVLGSTDAGKTWDTTRWPAVPDNSFHADCLSVRFDPFDPTGNTLVVGSDGGLFVSKDLGVTWDTSRNTSFPTLMFDQRSFALSQALSASSGHPGLLVGALQDNGTVYLSADGEPWRELQGGDGFRALFVTPDVALRGGNDTVDLQWARWNGNAFDDPVPLEPPGYPSGTQFMPILGRVIYPTYRDPAGNALMVAVAGDDPPTGNVFGMFDRGSGHSPAGERFYWKQLGKVPHEVNGIGSLSGKSVIVGTVGPHVYRLDARTGSVVELSLPSGLGSLGFRQIAIASQTLAFGLVGSRVLRTTNGLAWAVIPGPPGTTVDALDVDRGFDPVALFLAGSHGAWVSRDLGDAWQPTSGLPHRPRATHLETVTYGNGKRSVGLATWNWSAWRADLT